MSLFSVYWTTLLREMLPWAATLFILASFTGSEFFFLAVIAVGYWAVDKQLSKQVAILLLFSSVSNYWLKSIIRNPRPPQSNWLPGVSASNYSLPSGHSQSSTVFWGWVGVSVTKKYVQVSLFALIILVGVSRVYLGVHWLGDVLSGWLIGAFILSIVIRFKESFFSMVDSTKLYFFLVVAGLSMFVIESISTGFNDNLGSLGGLMIGAGSGFLLEKKYVDFNVSDVSLSVRLLRAGVGLVVLSLVIVGLATWFPITTFWLMGIRYALIVVTALFIWPYLFTRLKK
jgi:membrane-associated phospholipid phosphatase